MVLDEDGILWIGTNVGGLNRFDTKTKNSNHIIISKKGFTVF